MHPPHPSAILSALSALVLLTAPIRAGLVAHFPFDADFSDAAGSYALTAAGAATAGRPGAMIGTGALGGATGPNEYLDGLVDQVRGSTDFPISGTSPRTISVWFKTPPDPGPPDNGPTLVGMGNSTANFRRFDLRLSTVAPGSLATNYDGYLRLEAQGAARNSVADLEVDNEQWHHALISFTGGTGASLNNATLYLNGKSVDLASNTSVLNTAAAPLVIGGSNHTVDTARNFHGLIDDVGVWDEALAADDARILHGLGRVGGNNLSLLPAARSLWVDAAFGATAEFGGLVWEKADELPGVTGDWASVGGPNGIGSYLVLDDFGGGLRIVGLVVQAADPRLTVVGFQPGGGFKLTASGLDSTKTYRLMRGSTLSSFPDQVGPPVTGATGLDLVDPAPPPGKAFYRLDDTNP